MTSNKLPLQVLLELPNVTEAISYPLKSSQRIKYTCFDVSRNLIAFGATSGGIYVFNRNPCEFVQLIPNKDGAITRLAISPDERHIAFANARGTLTATVCDQTLNTGQKSVTSKEHQGNEVTGIIWSANNMLFSGDDIGRISVMQMPNFIAKTMFQSAALTIMNLDSRICQLDVKDSMLLVSTLTRCYVCDTHSEQYRQIGQKLRDGEYGACFYTKEKYLENGVQHDTKKDYAEVKTFNIVDGSENFNLNQKLKNAVILCARPSSRLWEASMDGTVQRTHQFKQVLARHPVSIITNDAYNNQNLTIQPFSNQLEGRSCNFPKIYNLKSAIFSFKKDALYFLDLRDVDNTMWTDTYKDIVECKIYQDLLYLWLQNGSLVTLRYFRIEKFVLNCYLDEKYKLCTELCALFSNYFMNSINLSTKLNVLVSLRDKIQDSDVLKRIEDVLTKFDSLKTDATQMKSGIYVVDNTYVTQASLFSDNEDAGTAKDENKYPSLNYLSSTMTDKLNSSKKMLKEKWEDLEGKVKNLADKHNIEPRNNEAEKLHVVVPERIKISDVPDDDIAQVPYDNDVVYKESSQTLVIDDTNKDGEKLRNDKICKTLYQCFRLSLVSEDEEQSNLASIIDSYSCNIKDVYQLMLLLDEYCKSVGAIEESKYAPNCIFLKYLSLSPKEEFLDEIINDEVLYQYFIDSCITVNMRNQKLLNLGCACGYPLPYTRTNQLPVYSEVIDRFIERQWLKHEEEQCYDICKKMPYLWRKILYLRRNEDLMNILRLLLQMLDEQLLHSFLPQFTLEAWDRAIQLYAVLHANKCLYCNKSFDHISVKNTLSWNDLGALIIKSVGGRNAIQLMEKHALLIDTGEISMKFYHTCLLAALYEKCDKMIVSQITDAVYSSYEYDDARESICKLLKTLSNGQIKNTALPITVAAKTKHWGLEDVYERLTSLNTNENQQIDLNRVTLRDILENLDAGNTDCSLCGLPLVNEVLIRDAGLWVFKCGHIFHGACLELNKIKLCSSSSINNLVNLSTV